MAVEVEKIKDEVREWMLRAILERGLEFGEAGVAVRAEDDDFAVEGGVLCGKARDGFSDGGHAVCPVEAFAGKKFDLRARLARLDAVAVELELMQPVAGRGWGRGFEGELRGDEGGLGFFGELGEGGARGRGRDFRSGLQPSHV